MNRRNLIILLIMPFVIALLGMSVITMSLNFVDNDILGIIWNYSDTEGFKVGSQTRLEAYGVNDKNYPVTNTTIYWSVENIDLEEESHASIVNTNYLYALTEGTVRITATNDKGNVYRSFTGLIYEGSALIVNPEITGSGTNVDSTRYFGQYDLVDNQKVNATIPFKISAYGSISEDSIYVDNPLDIRTYASVDFETNTITILQPGEITIRFASLDSPDTYDFSFTVVEEGVNVYTYDDLLYCTNESEEGEIVVLCSSLESLDNTYNTDTYGNISTKVANNIELFGHYDETTGKYSFENEVYRMKTTYDDTYIQEWNSFASLSNAYTELSNEVIVGIHVQKDFYGNGYTINLHNLTFPYAITDASGYSIPTLSNDNLFRGPLPLYMLGDPNGSAIIGLYGQDNIGMYVDGDNITINDLVLKNCDFGNSLSYLEYTGSVMEVCGDNVTIENSRLSAGKNVLRIMSSSNCLVDNCMLIYAQNFLIYAGSNNQVGIDDNTYAYYYDQNGNSVYTTLSRYLANGSEGDILLSNYLNGYYTSNMESSIRDLQAKLNPQTSLEYDGDITVNDTLFYTSGVASIGLDCMFNGPYLYNAIPSAVKGLFDSYLGSASSSLIPFYPTGIGCNSYPVEITISGNTMFYDYKNIETMDVSGLIYENISSIFGSLGSLVNVDSDSFGIDEIFPIKSILLSSAERTGNIYAVQNADGSYSRYINIPVVNFGGGYNGSSVKYVDCPYSSRITSSIEVDLLERYMGNSYTSSSSAISNLTSMLYKSVTVVTGFNSYYFSCARGDGYLFDEAPRVATLIENLKGR